MTTPTDRRRKLRALLASSSVFPALGCSDPVSARLAEHMGFQAIHASGSAAHRTRGYSDAGILDMTEMVSHLRYLCDAVQIPVIGDADTGFGNVVNVVRTVREYERAGAAAVHIEDQVTPKRPVYQGGSGEFVTRREMVDKIRAAVDARTDSELVIVARCDVKDAAERRERLLECLDNGADVGWISGRDADALRTLRRAFQKPSMGVLPGGMSLTEYASAGGNCALIVGAMQVAALASQMQLLEALRTTGDPRTYLETLPTYRDASSFYSGQGNAELKAIEERFGGA